jgi:hypothetical protein
MPRASLTFQTSSRPLTQGYTSMIPNLAGTRFRSGSRFMVNIAKLPELLRKA